MQLTLKVVGGQKDGDDIKVAGPKFLIGRDADCHLRPNSDLISRHHCILILDQGYVGIRDFNSKNGTFVNGDPIHGECELKSGDELEIGPLHFRVHLETGLGGPKRPKVKDVKEAVARTAQMAGDELDIDDWLEGDDPEGDTKTLDGATSATESLSDTSEIRLQNETLPSPPTAEEPADDSSSITDKLKELEEEKKPKDTQAAAINVLREFRKQQLQKQKQHDKDHDKKDKDQDKKSKDQDKKS